MTAFLWAAWISRIGTIVVLYLYIWSMLATSDLLLLQTTLTEQMLIIPTQYHHIISHHSLILKAVKDMRVKELTTSFWGWCHLPSLDLPSFSYCIWWKSDLDCFLPSLLLHILLSAVPAICTPKELSQLDVNYVENWGKKEMAPDQNKMHAIISTRPKSAVTVTKQFFALGLGVCVFCVVVLVVLFWFFVFLTWTLPGV